MKLHMAGTWKRLNVEHRTFNIERPMSLPLKVGTVADPTLIDRIHYSMLDVRRSMFIF